MNQAQQNQPGPETQFFGMRFVAGMCLFSLPLIVLFSYQPNLDPISAEIPLHPWWWVLIGVTVACIGAALAVRISARNPRKYVALPDPIGQAQRTLVGSVVITYLLCEVGALCGLAAAWMFDDGSKGLSFLVPVAVLMIAWFPQRKRVVIFLQQTRQLVEVLQKQASEYE